MRIPSRAQADAFCGAPATRYQRLAAILAPVILLGSLAFILIVWHTLPQRIPSNYNTAGEITGYSSRGTLLILPIIGIVGDLILALVGRIPQSWNTGVRITVQVRVYRLVRDLMADLRLSFALIFGGFGLYLATLPEHFSGNVTGGMILLSAVPLVRYFIRLPRVK